MNAVQALAFVARHGIVLEATRRGAIPSLADTIAGETLHGNWWAHPRSREIFAVTRAVRDAPDVLVCRLVDCRITFVHARLWSALYRCADAFAAPRLARLREVHGASGAHRVEEIPFPDWLDADTVMAAQRLDERSARAVLDDALATVTSTP